MIEELRKNVDAEIELLREIAKYNGKLANIEDSNEKKMLSESIESLKKSMELINNSIPSLLNNVSIAKKLPPIQVKTNLSKISYRRAGGEMSVILHVNDKDRFLKELNISERLIKRLKRIYSPVIDWILNINNQYGMRFKFPSEGRCENNYNCGRTSRCSEKGGI